MSLFFWWQYLLGRAAMGKPVALCTPYSSLPRFTSYYQQPLTWVAAQPSFKRPPNDPKHGGGQVRHHRQYLNNPILSSENCCPTESSIHGEWK